MDRFGRVLGRCIALVGFLFTVFIAIILYKEFLTPPCNIEMNQRGTSYVCEDFRANSGVEVNGINQLFNPYTDEKILEASNNDLSQVNAVVRSMINRGQLKERINWNAFQSNLSILLFAFMIFLFGIPIGKFFSKVIKNIFA